MSYHYKLVLRNSVPGDKTSIKKFYAMAVSIGHTNLRTVCDMIQARSSLSAADVKAVLDSLNYILGVELKRGNIVELGEFGHFRIAAGSEGVLDEKDFRVGMIGIPKIVFTPGEELNETRKTIVFTKEPTKEDPTIVGIDEPHEDVVLPENGDENV